MPRPSNKKRSLFKDLSDMAEAAKRKPVKPGPRRAPPAGVAPLPPEMIEESRYLGAKWLDGNGASGGTRLRATGESLSRFLRAFAETGVATRAAREAGLSYGDVVAARRRFPEFEEAYQELREFQVDFAEDELWRRAVQGWEEPVFHKGEAVGTVRRFSDACLVQLLKCRRPKTCNPQARVDHTSSDGSMSPTPVLRPDEETVRRLNDLYVRLEAEKERGEPDGSRH